MTTTQTGKAKFRVQIDADRCKSCRLCVDFCPKQVLGMTTDRLNAKGVTFAESVRPEQCIGCMACTLMCPDAAIELYKVED
jgi:2-oxoglutarate ferredoxin oxidoreductase subunit delta